MEKDDKSIKMSQKKVNVSIICASTNGKIKLPNLVRSISQGSYIPKELIIVGTSLSDKQLLLKYLNKNINFKFLVSKKKNQIFQRNIAKKVSKYDLILQTDDEQYNVKPQGYGLFCVPLSSRFLEPILGHARTVI